MFFFPNFTFLIVFGITTIFIIDVNFTKINAIVRLWYQNFMKGERTCSSDDLFADLLSLKGQPHTHT